jgi:outer membrane protein assembly factor BamD
LTILAVALLVFSATLPGCGGRRAVSELTSSELFDAGMEAYEDEDYLDAIDYFQACIYNYPGRTVVDSAQYYLGLSYFGNEEYQVAEVEFSRLVSNYPASVYFEHAVFMRAVCSFESAPDHYGLDQTELETALDRMEDFVIDFPESELVPDAQEYIRIGRNRLAKKAYRAGVVYHRMGAYKAARKYFQEVIDEYTDTQWAARATYMLAEENLKLSEFDKARQGFEDFQVVFPDHEWADEASEKAEEAAFKAAVKLYDAGELVSAREHFEQFKQRYPTSGRIDDANDYLEQITQATGGAAEVTDAES